GADGQGEERIRDDVSPGRQGKPERHPGGPSEDHDPPDPPPWPGIEDPPDRGPRAHPKRDPGPDARLAGRLSEGRGPFQHRRKASRQGDLFEVLRDQLGHLEQADLLLAPEDLLERLVGVDHPAVLAVLQLVLLDVVPELLGDLRPWQRFRPDDLGEHRVGRHRLHERGARLATLLCGHLLLHNYVLKAAWCKTPETLPRVWLPRTLPIPDPQDSGAFSLAGGRARCSGSPSGRRG